MSLAMFSKIAFKQKKTACKQAAKPKDDEAELTAANGRVDHSLLFAFFIGANSKRNG
jgi:hypothetical protein